MNRRSVAELAALARDARERDTERAIGARGFGFAIATSLETELGLTAGGYKVANLPFDVSIELTVGRVLNLTQGALFVSSHAEELFNTSLYVAGPGDAVDVFAFYCGSSGLALGLPSNLIADHPFQATEVAACWCDALAKVAPLDWCMRTTSDFGRSVMGLRNGLPIGRRNPHVEPCCVPMCWEADVFERAAAAAESATGLDGEAMARFLVDLRAANLVAMRALDGGDEPQAIEERQRRTGKIADSFWLPAFAWTEAALAARPLEMPPCAHLEAAAKVLAFPQSRELVEAIGRERASALYAQLQDRLAAALGGFLSGHGQPRQK